MALYDVNGNEIVVQNSGTDTEQELIASSGYNTYKSGGEASAVAYKKNLTFAVISDLHGSSQPLIDFVSYINEKTTYLDFAICLGDNVPIGGDADTTWFDSALNNSNVPIYGVVGNHDVRGVNLSTALTKIFTTPKSKGWMETTDFGDTNNGYWYKDFSDYNMRIIGLMEYDNADLLKGNNLYSEYKWYDTAQLQWFADTLYNTPSAYSVVVFTHQPLINSSTRIDNSFSKSGTFSTSAPTAIDGEPIGDIINAFVTGGSISTTYSPTSAMSSLVDKTATVAKDFSSRGTGKFACHICGHTHSSWILQHSTYSSIKSVVVPSGSSNIYQRLWDDVRYKNTAVNKNNFYVIGIDTDTKNINLVKVGSDVTVNMTERRFDKVSY